MQVLLQKPTTKEKIPIKEKIREFAKKLNIEYTGFCSLGDESLIVFLFPYFTGFEKQSNISLYCRSVDYHLIIKNYLNKISTFIKDEFNIESTPFVDIDDVKETIAAQKAGLGFIGKNHLLINEKYGTFAFIGILKTSYKFDHDEENKNDCGSCVNCLLMCPNALKSNDFSKCLSEISQKKGELTDTEKTMLKKYNIVFGCDICQVVCPLNTFEKTPIKDFYENRISYLKKEMFENLSNKEFNEKYKNRAFSWRGKSLLLRNIMLSEEENNQLK